MSLRLLQQNKRVTINNNKRFLFGIPPTHWTAYRVFADGVNNFINTITDDWRSPAVLELCAGGHYINEATDDLINGIADAFTNQFTLNVQGDSFEGNTGDNIQLSATIQKNEAPFDAPVVWKSSNELVATVDENGLVTCISLGAATITAEMEHNEFIFDTADIRVIDTMPMPLNEIRVEPNQNFVMQGEEVIFTAKLFANNVEIPDTFTFTLLTNHILDKYYNFKILSDAQFSVLNKLSFVGEPLRVHIADSSGNELIWNIELRGMW